MTLNELTGKTCWIGLSYFNLQGELLKQSQLGGTVRSADAVDGIAIELLPAPNAPKDELAVNAKPPQFKLPPELSCWFNAPKGKYRDAHSGMNLENPDYLVTWDIHQTKETMQEGKHEWWEWVPRAVPPTVG